MSLLKVQVCKSVLEPASWIALCHGVQLAAHTMMVKTNRPRDTFGAPLSRDRICMIFVRFGVLSNDARNAANFQQYIIDQLRLMAVNDHALRCFLSRIRKITLTMILLISDTTRTPSPCEQQPRSDLLMPNVDPAVVRDMNAHDVARCNNADK